MTVFILDLDWLYDKSEIPNADCMKLSSFYKQKGHQVYFVGDISELTMAYDALCVFSNSDSTPTLSYKILNDKRTTLFGKKFELCGGKSLGPVIMGCRPDYLLYNVTNEKSNSYTKANFVTFYTSRGEVINTRQPWKNTKSGVKRTIVTDDLLWEQKPEEIVKCLQELENDTNIVFLNPISLKCLINNPSVQESFFKLHFSRGTKFKWRNDVGHMEAEARQIADFLVALKQHTKSKIGVVPIKPLLDGENGEQCLERLLRVFAIFKQNKIKCLLPRKECESKQLLKWLCSWCERAFDLSFIEEFVFFSFARKGVRWFQIINDPHAWGSAQVKFLIQLLSQEKWQKLLPQMSIQWGNDSIDFTCIKFDIINKYGSSLI